MSCDGPAAAAAPYGCMETGSGRAGMYGTLIASEKGGGGGEAGGGGGSGRSILSSSLASSLACKWDIKQIVQVNFKSVICNPIIFYTFRVK